MFVDAQHLLHADYEYWSVRANAVADTGSELIRTFWEVTFEMMLKNHTKGDVMKQYYKHSVM